MKDQHISIIPINTIELIISEQILAGLKEVFAFKVTIHPGLVVPAGISGLEYNDRYNSTALLEFISGQTELFPDAVKVLALTEHDLYSPIFSKMFGEAQLGGRFALISLYRLASEFYDEKPDKELFISRCQKEAIHELGHTFGLTHCKNINCTMYPSSTISDTDIKSDKLCIVCSGLLKGLIFNI